SPGGYLATSVDQLVTLLFAKYARESEKPISPLRRRMIEDMTVRNFVEKTRNDYIRHVCTFTAFLGRSPDTPAPEDLRRFQLHQTQTGVRPPTINNSVAALGFFFPVTVGRTDMARHLTRSVKRGRDRSPAGGCTRTQIQ